MIGGLEIHPAIVHFPIALTVVGALGALAYLFLRREWLRWFAPILLSLALMGAVAAYFTGQAAEDRAEDLGVPKAAIEQHEETGLWAIGFVGLACFLSWATHAKGRGQWIAALVAIAAAGLVLWNGHLGGRLVFVHGAGRVQGAHTGAPPTSGPGD
ncbi:MAG: DUF2231 domain-containing protein [Candidatus Eiseniibacteriota bacterium]